MAASASWMERCPLPTCDVFLLLLNLLFPVTDILLSLWFAPLLLFAILVPRPNPVLQVLAVAVGASVAAAVIIILTLICLCMWR